MGRVYNALVKANRFQDTDRPIGRPERDGAKPDNQVGSARFSRKSSSTEAVPSNSEAKVELTGGRTRSTFSESSAELVSTRVPTAVNVPAPLPRTIILIPRGPVVEIPAARAQVIAFEEPANITNIRELAIDPHVAALTADDSLATERYRALALKLLNLTSRRKMKTLLITSAQAGDGTTTIATGAAWFLAKGAERRVLLIDASPTSSPVGRMLGIKTRRGWLNLLDGSSDLRQALVRLEPRGLYLLTAGARSATRSNDGWSGRLEDLIADLTPHFDLVVVDSGSILESSETQRLASVLDGAVIVARANHTHHRKVAAARKLVPKERRLGVVLNESGTGAESSPRAASGKGLVRRLFRRG